MKQFLLALALTLIAPTFIPQVTGNIVQAQEQPLWIDVRTSEEFAAGHLKSAVLIPYNEIANKIGGVAPDKRRRINLYCQTGRRAEIALHTLEALGYVSVQNLGGINELKQQGIK